MYGVLLLYVRRTAHPVRARLIYFSYSNFHTKANRTGRLFPCPKAKHHVFQDRRSNF